MNKREWHYNLTDEQYDKLLEISHDLHAVGIGGKDAFRNLVNGIFKRLATDEMNKQVEIMMNGTGTSEPIGFLNNEQA